MWVMEVLIVTRFKCLLIVAVFTLSSGQCENAEPRQTTRLKDYEGLDQAFSGDEYVTTPPSSRRFNWDSSPESVAALDERRSISARDADEPGVVPGGNSDDKRALFLPTTPEINNVATVRTTSRRKGRNKGYKKRRQGKQRRVISRVRQYNSTIPLSTKVVSNSTQSNDTMNSNQNQIRKDVVKEMKRVDTKHQTYGSNVNREKRLKQARERRKKLRIQRRRRKNRERRRKSELKQNGSNRKKTKKMKNQQTTKDVPAALSMEQLQNVYLNDTRRIFRNFPNVTNYKILNESDPIFETSSWSDFHQNQSTSGNPNTTSEDEFSSGSKVEKSTEMSSTKSTRLGDNVERTFSKHVEKELLQADLSDSTQLAKLKTDSMTKSSTDSSNRSSSQINTNPAKSDPNENPPKFSSNRIESSRYDSKKMLSYSSENKLPVFDSDNEVLTKISKDYDDYMTAGLKMSEFVGNDSHSIYGDQSLRKNSFPDSSNSTSLMADTPTPVARRDFDALYRITSRDNKGSSGAALRKSKRIENEKIGGNLDPAIVSLDVDSLEGDLSCMNGSFLPAPLARHALIKYVKSSAPGHEYLEADYECTPGFYMATSTSRLLCVKRRWIGRMPKCNLRKNPVGMCAQAACDQVCKELDGQPKCFCYKGFRSDGHKCIDIDECEQNNGGCESKCVNTPGSYRCECPRGMKYGENKYTCIDINECLLNNGHGPCQETCRNLKGGYQCSCDKLPGTILAPDNHTCQDAGPCSINNAGCSHTCLSTMGRVFCLCPDGFMLEDDWKTCQDVDECAVPDLQAEVCQYGCINTPGSYRCAEPSELRDQPIAEPLIATCAPGYEASENGSCLDINNMACPPLNPDGRGYVMCSRLMTPKPWRGRKKVINRPGTKCSLKCPHGYQLRGEYELTCRANGSWDGPSHGECVRYSKPRLECPKDITVEVSPGQKYAFVAFPQPSTDLDWFRYVTSEPSWGTRLEANLKPGQHKITFLARHPVSKKQSTCVLRITVKKGEAPSIKDCPKDIHIPGKNHTTVSWTEPIFTDNVKVVHITSNKSPGCLFPVGQHKIEYEAHDEAGWTAKCDFAVTIGEV